MSKCDCNDNRKIRIVSGNDLTVEAVVSVWDAKECVYVPMDLTGASDVALNMVTTFTKVHGEGVSASGSRVSAFFPAGRLGKGVYGVEITFRDADGRCRAFERSLIEVVESSGEATVESTAEGETGDGLNITVDVRTRTVRIGGTGATDYPSLTGKPSINGVVLEGNKTPEELGMYSKEEADGKFETKESAAESDKRVQGMLDGKVDKEPGKGLSANDLTDERAGKVDKLVTDGRANEYLNGAGTYSRPVRQGYGVSVKDDNTVSVDPQVIARQSDVANVAAAVAALQSLIDILNSDSNVDGSVRKTVADAIARVVAGAPEDLDTLKEIADYIASDKTGAAQLAAAISQLQTLTEAHTSNIRRNAAGVAENKAEVDEVKKGLKGYYQKTDARLDHRVVAEAIVSLAARLDALEGSRDRLGDATAGTVDVRGLTRCRYPLVMLGRGVPAEANVPVNLPDGLPWDGVPAFAGQQYINLDAESDGLYYAAGVDSVADWKQA
nr:MAG TPA: hypothetical protein [Caudoviricetes sp.]